MVTICASPTERRGRSRGVEPVTVGDDELEALAADLDLQLVGRALGMTQPWSITAIRSASRSALLEVLRRRQQRRAAAHQLGDDVPHA